MKFDRAVDTTKTSTFEAIPEGWYNVEVVSVEEKASKTNSQNIYIEYKYLILGPSHSGRYLFDKFNVVNTSEKAVEIAFDNLGRQGNALGFTTNEGDDPYTDSNDAVGRRMDIFVRKIEDPEKEGSTNEIRGYRPYSVEGGYTKPTIKADVSKPVISRPASKPNPSAPAIKKAPWAK